MNLLTNRHRVLRKKASFWTVHYVKDSRGALKKDDSVIIVSPLPSSFSGHKSWRPWQTTQSCHYHLSLRLFWLLTLSLPLSLREWSKRFQNTFFVVASLLYWIRTHKNIFDPAVFLFFNVFLATTCSIQADYDNHLQS